MWRLTFPFVRTAIREHRFLLPLVVAGGFVAGYVATARSFMESLLLDQAQRLMADRDAGEFLGAQIGRPDDGLVGRLTGAFTPGVSTAGVLLLYVVVTAAGVALAAVTAYARESVSRILFTSLFSSGVQASLSTTTPTLEPNEPGGLSGAVQQGALAVASSWAFMLAALQHVIAILTIAWLLKDAGWFFGLGCVVVATALSLLSVLQARRLAKDRESFDEKRRQLFAHTDDVLSNRDVIVAHERDREYVGRLAGWTRDVGSVDRRVSIREQVFEAVSVTIFDSGRLVTLLIVVLLTLAGLSIGPVGDTYFFVSIYSRLLSPVMGLTSGYDKVKRSASTSKTLLDLIATRRADDDEATDDALGDDSASDAITITNVSYTYPDGKQVLRDCSLNVPRGGVTLVLGRSGEGKTTLARLLLGFLHPDDGTITILGVDRGVWTHRGLLARMSYLSQNRHVVEGTVEDNLFADPTTVSQIGRTLLTDALIAVLLARTEAEAERLLAGQARELSEGQKQRLALARILVDRSAIVILDEPLAGIDALTFAEVRGALGAWLTDRARTVILISHRLAFSAHANHVAILDGGRIVEEGSREELQSLRHSRFRQILDEERAALPQV